MIAPVADLVGQPMQSYYSHQPPTASYQKLPWACYKTEYEACPRVHQLIYHELVDILAYKGDEVHIQIPQVFYQTRANDAPQNQYWTLKKNVLPITKKIDLSKLPKALQCNHDNTANYTNTISLIEPFTEPTTNTTFSAGTRFIKENEQPNKDTVSAYWLHLKTHTIKTVQLPQSKVYTFTNAPMRQRINDFIAILRGWTTQNGGVIPYVWGGCSFTQTHLNNEYVVQKNIIRNKMLGYYTRPSHKGMTKTGYDCSSIIVRAAHIVGLPYYYKNTYTITKQLPLLAPHEELHVGDLIWIYGHVLVVADLKKNTVIEAHAYDGGHGKVHEIPISKVFKEITTLQDLHAHYCEKKPVERLHCNGSIFDKYKEVKLFKFASQWI